MAEAGSVVKKADAAQRRKQIRQQKQAAIPQDWNNPSLPERPKPTTSSGKDKPKTRLAASSSQVSDPLEGPAPPSSNVNFEGIPTSPWAGKGKIGFHRPHPKAELRPVWLN